MKDGILSTIGNTPLVQLNRVFDDISFWLYAKMETFNPGGSCKDRPAFAIIQQALISGELRNGSVVIESSSGNMGIGLAQACSFYGLRLICVVDPKTTAQNIKLIKAYGGEVDMVEEPDPVTGEYLQARINRVNELLAEHEDSVWPNQYANLNNPLAHHQTMREIDLELGGAVDYVFCATSTCGTMRGCVEYVRKHNLHTRVIAVDAVGSVIFGGKNGKRLIPGHGAAIKPPLFQPDLADRSIQVTDLDCVVGCRRLARREAILAGGSSGAVLSAVSMLRNEIHDGANCVMILADRGERYLDTIYSDDWVQEHFGIVSHFWETREQQACAVMTY